MGQGRRYYSCRWRGGAGGVPEDAPGTDEVGRPRTHSVISGGKGNISGVRPVRGVSFNGGVDINLGEIVCGVFLVFCFLIIHSLFI